VRHWFLALLLGPCGLGAAPSVAEQVTLAVPVSMEPYFLPHEGRGLIFDVAREAFAVRGSTVVPFYISQRQNATILAKNPQVDCATLQPDQPSKTWHTLKGNLELHDYAISLAAKRLRIERLEDLKGKSIIAYAGAREFLGPEFQAAVKDSARYREIRNHRTQVKLLLKGRVDVIIADRLLVQWYLHYLEEKDGVRIPVRYHNLFEPVRFISACRHKHLIDEFLLGMEELRKTKVLDQIIGRYTH
jgi:polar amino acid transport system substrate-binding protein